MTQNIKIVNTDNLDNLEKMKNQSRWGGKRENAGRPEGSLCKQTIEKKIAEKIIENRVINSLDALLNSQFNIAEGCAYLYKTVITEVDGKKIKQKPELVTSKAEIKAYLAGDYDDSEEEYYYITTERPDNKAIDSLLNRVFGTATINLNKTGEVLHTPNNVEFEKFFDLKNKYELELRKQLETNE